MRILVRVLPLLMIAAMFASGAFADQIYLKNGRMIEGVVVGRDQRAVEVNVGIGTVKFKNEEVDRIVSADLQDNVALQQRWAEKKVRDDQLRKQALEEERLRKERAPKEITVTSMGNHLIVQALLNGNVNANLMVDTGASLIVLNSRIGAQLGIGRAGNESQLGEFTVADGRKVQAHRVSLSSVKVQDAEAYNVEAAVMVDSNPDEKIDGLLGMSFLGNFNFQIDPKNNKLILHKSQ